MALDAQTYGGTEAGIAEVIRTADTKRDRVSLTLDALILIADAEWLPILRALKEAREWEHDDEIAASQWEEVAREAERIAEDCRYHAENPGER